MAILSDLKAGNRYSVYDARAKADLKKPDLLVWLFY